MAARLLVAVQLALLLSACAGNHVTFFNPNTVADAPDETRIFMDARGDLYPQSGISGEYVLPDQAEGSLFEAARGNDPRLCQGASAGTEMAELCAAVITNCSGTSTLPCFQRWEEVQDTLWERRGKALAARFTDDTQPTIGVLIHGFNNWYRESQANYATAERQMRRFLPDNQTLHFVEIYWDGCRGNDMGIGCWSRAQSSGPLAGFALRRLFNSVEEGWPPHSPKPRWRVLTHSSGAFVAGAILGDPTAALPQLQAPSTNRWYGRFAEHRTDSTGLARVPQLSDIRLGMFAPATPSITFTGAPKRGEGILSTGLTVLTVVQPDDGALNKKFLGCQRLGASCLGAEREQACALQQAAVASDRDLEIVLYDFTRPRSLWGDEVTLHDYSVYVRQAANRSTFFRDFMSAQELPVDHGPLVVC